MRARDDDEKDYFIFQAYRDVDRYIFSEWGFGAQGTYAGGACLLDIIIPISTTLQANTTSIHGKTPTTTTCPNKES